MAPRRTTTTPKNMVAKAGALAAFALAATANGAAALVITGTGPTVGRGIGGNGGGLQQQPARGMLQVGIGEPSSLVIAGLGNRRFLREKAQHLPVEQATDAAGSNAATTAAIEEAAAKAATTAVLSDSPIIEGADAATTGRALKDFDGLDDLPDGWGIGGGDWDLDDKRRRLMGDRDGGDDDDNDRDNDRDDNDRDDENDTDNTNDRRRRLMSINAYAGPIGAHAYRGMPYYQAPYYRRYGYNSYPYGAYRNGGRMIGARGGTWAYAGF